MNSIGIKYEIINCNNKIRTSSFHRSRPGIHDKRYSFGILTHGRNGCIYIEIFKISEMQNGQKYYNMSKQIQNKTSTNQEIYKKASNSSLKIKFELSILN